MVLHRWGRKLSDRWGRKSAEPEKREKILLCCILWRKCIWGCIGTASQSIRFRRRCYRRGYRCSRYGDHGSDKSGIYAGREDFLWRNKDSCNIWRRNRERLYIRGGTEKRFHCFWYCKIFKRKKLSGFLWDCCQTWRTEWIQCQKNSSDYRKKYRCLKRRIFGKWAGNRNRKCGTAVRISGGRRWLLSAGADCKE